MEFDVKTIRIFQRTESSSFRKFLNLGLEIDAKLFLVQLHRVAIYKRLQHDPRISLKSFKRDQ